MSSKDRRIVELEFDNKSFENGVKETLKSLNSLDKNLDNLDGKSLKGLQDSLSDVSFKGIEDGIESLNQKFSYMGTFVRGIIANLANDVYDLGKQIASSTLGQIISGGSKRALNIQQARFMFQGLGLDEEEGLRNAEAAVIDTAYGLDEAAVAAAQLAASGVQLGDDMTESLQSISGLAAMTGSDYSSIAQIFATVAGNGRLMGEQLLQVGTRGINAAAAIAEYLSEENQMIVTEADVREMVTGRQISFEIFSKAMHKFWAQAARANELYSGALANVKAALSRMGEPIMDQFYKSATDVLNAIRPVLNAFKKAILPFYDVLRSRMKDISDSIVGIFDVFKDEKKTELNDSLLKTFTDIGKILENLVGTFYLFLGVVVKVFGAIKSAFKEVFTEDFTGFLVKLTDKFRVFMYHLRESDGIFSALRESFRALFSIIHSVFDIIVSIGSVLKPIFSNVIMPVFGFLFQEGLAIIEELSKGISTVFGWFRKLTEVEVFGKKIGDVLSNVRKAIENFTRIAVEKTHWFFDNFNELPKLFMNLWETIKNFASNTFKGVVEFFDGFGETLKKVKEGVGDSKIIQKLSELFDKIKEFVSGIKLTDILYAIAGAFIYFKDTLKTVFDFLSPIFEGFFDMMKTFASTFKETIIGTLSGEAGGNLLSGGILATIIMLFEKFKKVGEALTLAGIQESVIGILEGVQGVLNSYQKSIDANNLWLLAKAIGVLALSIATLSMLDTKKVVQVTGVIMALGAGLAFFIKSFTRQKEVTTIGDALKSFADSVGLGIQSFLINIGQALSQAIKLDSIMLAMDMFAFAIMEMATSLLIISNIPWDKMKNGLIGMAACFVLLGGAFAAIKILSDKMDGKEVGKLAGTAAALGIAALSISSSMILFATSIAIFASTYEAHSAGFMAGLGAIGAIVIALVVAMSTLEKSFKEDSAFRLAAFAAAFLAMSASVTVLAIGLSVMAGAFELLTLIGWDNVLAGTITLGLILGSLAVSAKIMQGAWAAVLALSAAVGIISLAMYPLSAALGILSLIPWSSVEKFGAILAAFTASIVISAAGLAAASALMAKAGVDLESFGKSVLMFGTGVGAFGVGVFKLAESIVLLSLAGPAIKAAAIAAAEGLVAFVVALSNASGQLDAALQNLITKLIENILTGIKNAAGPMLGTIGEIIVNSLDNLNKYVPPIIDKLTTLIINVLNSLTDKIPALVDAVFEFLDAFLGAIGDHLGEFSLFDTALFAGFTVGFGFLIKWLGSIKKDAIAALPVVGVMGLILAELVAAFAILSAIDTGKLIVISAGLSATLLSLSAALFIASNIPIAGAVQGALGLAAFFGILVGATTIILSVLGLFDKIKGFRETIEAGKEVLLILGEAIGGFIGNLVGGIIEGVAEGIANSMGKLGDAVVDFASKIKSVDKGALDSAKNLAQVLLILGGAEIVNAIARFLGGDTAYEEMKTQIVEFADTLIAFYDKIKVLDEGAITKTLLASAAAKNLAEFAAYIPKTGGLLQKFTGTADFKGFAEAIEDFADAIMKVADKVSGITTDDVANINMAADAGKALTELNRSIPSTGGLWQLIAGGKDFSSFSDSMVKYGECLMKFAWTVSWLDDTAVENVRKATEMGKSMAELNKSIPASGGLWQIIAGGKSLTMFGADMVLYAQNLVSFAQKVSALPYGAKDRAQLAADMGKPLAELNNTIPTSDGLWDLIAGGNDMGKFGEDLALYGEGLKKFYESVKDLPSEAVTQAQTVVSVTQELTKLQEIIGSGDDGGNIFQKLGEAFLGIDTGTVSFTSMLKSLGDGLANFATSTSEIDFGSVSSARLELSNLIGLMSRIDATVGNAGQVFKSSLETMATTSIQGFVTAFSGSYQLVLGTIKTFFTGIINSIKQYEKPIEQEGQAFGKGLARGIASQSNTVGQSLITIMKGLVIYLALCEPTFQTEGQRTMQAYAKGLASAAGAAQSAMRSVANAAAGAMNISGNMYWAGVGAAQGFINGGYAMQNSVYWAYYSIGRLALQAAKNALDSHSPSKEFFKLGADTDRGLAEGLLGYSKLVEDSSTKVANVALDTVANSISRLSSMLENDIDINPTITPVMDLSQVQNGISGIDNLLSGVDGTSIRAVGSDIRAMRAVSNSMYNDSNVVTAITSLESRLDAVASRMENLQVVLDSGELVGATAPGMNNEFGTMDILVQRGVM